MLLLKVSLQLELLLFFLDDLDLQTLDLLAVVLEVPHARYIGFAVLLFFSAVSQLVHVKRPERLLHASDHEYS